MNAAQTEVQFHTTSKERHGLNGRLKVKKRLAVLFDDVKAEYPTIFRDSDSVDLNPEVLAYIVSQLQMYSLLESDIDVKGRAYEEIVGSNLRGDRGEFFTPRNVCQMMVTMLDPSEKTDDSRSGLRPRGVFDYRDEPRYRETPGVRN